jgi:hypothetical protein
MTAVDARFHATAPHIDAHLAAFLELADDDQRRHLRRAHRLPDPEPSWCCWPAPRGGQ